MSPELPAQPETSDVMAMNDLPKCAREEHGAGMRILYLVGVDASTSLALEVAGHVQLDSKQFRVVAYYAASDGHEEFVDTVGNLGARGRFDLKAPLRLFGLIRKWRPHVIHAHHTVSAFWGAVAGWLCGVPIIVKTEHDDHRYYNVGQDMLNFVTQLLSDRLICNSDRTYEHFHSWEKQVAREKSVTIYNGVDVERINRPAARAQAVRSALGFRNEHFVVGSVGRLIRQKNYEVLIRSIPEVIQDAPNTRFLLVGNGPLRQRLENVAREVNVREYITFTGGVKRERVFELLHIMDVFVVPSSWEGFCNAAVEAMAANRPLISSDIDTLHEVVGGAAMYAAPCSPGEFARAILDFVHMSESERRQYGAACRQRAESNFSVRRTADAYCRTYRDLLDEKFG